MLILHLNIHIQNKWTYTKWEINASSSFKFVIVLQTPFCFYCESHLTAIFLIFQLYRLKFERQVIHIILFPQLSNISLKCRHLNLINLFQNAIWRWSLPFLNKCMLFCLWALLVVNSYLNWFYIWNKTGVILVIKLQWKKNYQLFLRIWVAL